MVAKGMVPTPAGWGEKLWGALLKKNHNLKMRDCSLWEFSIDIFELGPQEVKLKVKGAGRGGATEQ